MNVLILLSMLKKGWEVSKSVLIVLWKYWYIVVISLLLLINTALRNDIVSLEKDKTKLYNDIVLLVQKQKQDLLEAQKKAQEKEIEILTKQKEVEVNYNEKIKALSNDVIIARNSANSLSKQLADNTIKLSTASKTEADAYNKSISIVLEDSARKYLDMAGEADTKRLAEARCVGLYNALVDGVDNPDTNNKE